MAKIKMDKMVTVTPRGAIVPERDVDKTPRA